MESFHSLLVLVITAITIFVLALLAYVIWRFNAMRNPTRTFSTAMALTIGVALVTLVTVVATGLKDSTKTSLAFRLATAL